MYIFFLTKFIFKPDYFKFLLLHYQLNMRNLLFAIVLLLFWITEIKNEVPHVLF